MVDSTFPISCCMDSHPELQVSRSTTNTSHSKTQIDDYNDDGLSSPCSSLSEDSLESLCDSDASRKALVVTPYQKTLHRVVNAVRFLTVDAVYHAKSGHIGMVMGMAPAACTLWDSCMAYNPLNPSWINRDRFVLSAGHGSMLHYSLLHIFGFENAVTMQDIMSFRKRGSRAAGHPENVLTPGVEVTTGALGQGICNAVGLALAESHLAAVYNRPQFEPLIDHYTFCIVGDGCLMEGISYEACSLAGHWRLGKLIVLYDNNSISIEGSTDLAFTEDVGKRFISFGWQVIEVSNGDTDLHAITNAIRSAKDETQKPTLIIVTTTIGYGMPSLSGSASVHGSCLDANEIENAKERLGWEAQPFEIPADVLMYTRRKQSEGVELERNWERNFLQYRKEYPVLAQRFEMNVLSKELPSEFGEVIESFCSRGASKKEATRKISGRVLNAIAEAVPGVIGGSADLGPSTVSVLNRFEDYQANCRYGRNIHFGVREHGMGSICNGIALHGSGLIPYCATFLVFSDYCRAAIRTAALSRAGVIFILTHDSVFIGQDGPTHQPVEHLAALRAMPVVYTMRPADQVEVATCYEVALRRRDGPSCIILSRQAFSAPPGCRAGTRRGGYTHSDNFTKASNPDCVIITTGSELGLLYEAADELRTFIRVRIVSMPCVELFNEQTESYQQNVLCEGVDRSRRLVVEAGSSFGWHRFADHMITVDEYGFSAPEQDIKDELKFTKEAIIDKVNKIIGADKSW